ncbi:MAG: glycosyltransferase family 39 protein [bacterium]|nr:glycosyltransferase family 39 protein [bacterium]
MKNKVVLLVLGIVLLLGICLRVYSVTNVPPGVNRDEASIGYNAYSLLQTGKDEYGELLPLSFQSFGDWKLPLYIYLTILPVKILGMSELSVRLVSILAGSTSIILTYLLVKKLFNRKNLALLSALLLAISPWHLHLSRVESESNLAVMLVTLAVYFFFKALGGQRKLLILSGLGFALTYYSYHGNHLFTSLLVLTILGLFYKSIPRTKVSVVAGLLFLVVAGFIFSKTLFSANTTKLSGISIFGDPTVVHSQIEQPRVLNHDPSSLTAKIAHNRLVFALERFGQNYLNSFSPSFLFINGGSNMAHNIPNFGNMYIIEAPFLLLGVVYLIGRVAKSGKNRKRYGLVLLWLLIAPIAASITKDAPHTNRMFAVFPVMPIITAMGILYLMDTLNNNIQLRKVILLTLVVGYSLNIMLYFERYYVHFPQSTGIEWGYAHHQLVDLLDNDEYMDKQVIMSQPEASPYIFLDFYSEYDPEQYQKTVNRYEPTDDAFVHVKSFGRYEFREINWAEDLARKNTILVDIPVNVPDSVDVTSSVLLPNSSLGFEVAVTE